MKTAGACPPIGPRIDRLVAMRLHDPAMLSGNEVERLVPLNLDERFAPAFAAPCQWAVFEPALPHSRPQHTRSSIEAGCDVAIDRRWTEVSRMALDLDQALILDDRDARAPVTCRQAISTGSHIRSCATI